MKDINFNKEIIDELYRHALKEYPDECCGIITNRGKNLTLHRCKNIQNRLHTEDPLRYPRDARTAYMIERSEFDRIIKKSQDSAEEIAAFYHSHCDHDAYFSEEDFAAQTVFGEPEFPGALHIVVSVRDGQIHEMKGYLWDGDTGRFNTQDLDS